MIPLILIAVSDTGPLETTGTALTSTAMATIWRTIFVGFSLTTKCWLSLIFDAHLVKMRREWADESLSQRTRRWLVAHGLNNYLVLDPYIRPRRFLS